MQAVETGLAREQVRVDDTLILSVHLVKTKTSNTDTTDTKDTTVPVMVPTNSGDEEEDRWVVTVTIDKQMVKCLFCPSPLAWAGVCDDISANAAPGKMILHVVATPLAAASKHSIVQQLEIMVLDDEFDSEDSDDDFNGGRGTTGGLDLGDEMEGEEEEEEGVLDQFVLKKTKKKASGGVGRVIDAQEQEQVEEAPADDEEWDDMVNDGGSRNGVSQRSAASVKGKKKKKSNKRKPNKKNN